MLVRALDWLEGWVASRKSKQFFLPTSHQRIQEFLIYCNGLEGHPAFVAHKNGGTISSSFNIPASGTGTSGVSFDVFHLESLLTRLRQFVFPGELFYVKDLRRAAVELFGEGAEFRKMYGMLMNELNKKFSEKGVRAFKSDGQDVVAGYTIKQLVEARLYTGAIHSERRLNAVPGSASAGLSGAHPIVRNHLDMVLMTACMGLIGNIFAFRHATLLSARAAGKVNDIPEMKDLDDRNKTNGT